MLTAAVLYSFPVLMIGAAVWDLLTLRIPNWQVLAVLGTFLVYAGLAPLSMAELGVHLGTGAAVLVAGLALFARGLLGGGDVKLLAATSVWIGWPEVVPYLFAVAVSGGVLALAILAFRRARLPRGWSARPWVRRLHEPAAGIPYGVAIGAAALLIYAETYGDLAR